MSLNDIEAVLFDFDGLMIDSETPGYVSWGEIYAEHGQELSLDRWSDAVGTLDGFDPVAHLGALTGTVLDRAELLGRREKRKDHLASLELARPGVREVMAEVDRMGIRRAIVSSGSRDWIERHLGRLDLCAGWACIASADGDPELAKPSPHLYRVALDCLRVSPARAIALEDSPNGIAAAKEAGLRCICIPNRITETMDLSAADAVMSSLTELLPSQP